MKHLMGSAAAMVIVLGALAAVITVGEGASAEEPSTPKDATATRRAAIKVELRAMQVPEVRFLPPQAQHPAAEIYGTWKADTELTDRVDGALGGVDMLRGTREGHLPTLRLRFTPNPASDQRIGKMLKSMLERDVADLLKYIDTLEEASIDPNYSALHIGRVEFANVFASGRYDFGAGARRKGDFAVIGISGMLTLLLASDELGEVIAMDRLDGCRVQFALDPKGSKDIMFLSGSRSSEKTAAWVRDGEQPKFGAAGEATSETAEESAPTGR